MRITKIDGYSWPLNIHCDCIGVDFEVASTEDISVKCDSTFKVIEGLPVPDIRTYTYFGVCPICGKMHQIPAEALPERLRKNIDIPVHAYFD